MTIKQVLYVFLILVNPFHLLHADEEDEIIETNTNATGFLIHNLIHQELVDTDIRLSPGTHKEDYFITEEEGHLNELPPLPPLTAFVRQFAARKKDDLSKMWSIPIPYVIDTSVDFLGNLGINDGIKEFEQKTCIKFRKKEDADHDFLRFVGNDDGCWSYVGRQGTGEQIVSLENVACRKFKTIIHEIMHAVGFWHEHSRSDRDKYVKIHYENIKPGQNVNFQKLKEDITDSFGVEYDYKSVMHYYRHAFSKNGNNTITRVDGGPPDFGQPASGSFSAKDLEQVNILYDCKGSWGEWIAGDCDVHCGIGKRTLTRECVGKPGCIGENIRTEECKKEPCKSDGEWTEWHSTLCNVTCGEGFTLHTRDCFDPQTHHASDTCVGESLKFEKCKHPPCSEYGLWGSWQEGSCSAVCGTGVRTYTRKCYSVSKCAGEATKFETCHELPCDCFPSNAFVRQKNGLKVPMSRLKLGDEVLTMGEYGLPIYSKIIMILHGADHQIIKDYIKIKTLDGIDITMSSNHLIPVSNNNYSFAKNLRQGDDVTVYDKVNNIFRTTKVVSANQVTETGIYAPLTMQGTLIVNDVYVSCYATFPSHTMSHHAFMLWRFLYTYFEYVARYFSKNDVIHWYPKTLYSIATTVGLL